jgi:hypothetical protein
MCARYNAERLVIYLTAIFAVIVVKFLWEGKMTEDSEIKFTRDDLIVLAVVVGFILLLCTICFTAGSSSGYRDALEGRFWHCIPKDSNIEVYQKHIKPRHPVNEPKKRWQRSPKKQ